MRVVMIGTGRARFAYGQELACIQTGANEIKQLSEGECPPLQFKIDNINARATKGMAENLAGGFGGGLWGGVGA